MPPYLSVCKITYLLFLYNPTLTLKYITQKDKKYNPLELILVNKFTKVKIYVLYKQSIIDLHTIKTYFHYSLFRGIIK